MYETISSTVKTFAENNMIRNPYRQQDKNDLPAIVKTMHHVCK